MILRHVRSTPFWMVLALLFHPVAPQATGQAQVSAPGADDPSAATDRAENRSPVRQIQGWMHNRRERTLAAVEALEQERFEDAVEAASTARRLDRGRPVGAFNEGTVRLLAGDAAGAMEPLEAAAQGDSELAAAAAYNLGNAHYETRQLDKAIEWYENSLRREPNQPAAKVNLELALRQRQQQQQRERQEQQQTEQENEEQRQPHSSEEQQKEEPTSDRGEPEDRQGDQESPLPRFKPRPDMTAEEAASLLEAVEAMEREARAELQPESRRAAPGNRDW